jgi:hypothetical protein
MANRFREIFQRLVDAQVEFLVVGGVAAVLQGAPVTTFDVDVVHSTEPGNVGRLLAALEGLNARYRYGPERRPDASHLSSPGHQLLITRFGPLDVLGSIGTGRSYAALLPHSVPLGVSHDLTVRVLDLETIIAVKEEVGAEKDRTMLPVLRRTLLDSRRREENR